MSRSINYNRFASIVNIDGFIATQVGDQFAFSIVRPEIATRTVGVTTSVLNQNSDKGGTIDIRLFGISTTNDKLEELYYNQVRSSAKEFDISILSSENESIGCVSCLIATPPTVEGGGPEQATRQWSFIFKEYDPDKDLFF